MARVPRWIVQSLVGTALVAGASLTLDFAAGAQGQTPPADANVCGPGYTSTPDKGCQDINECLQSNGECDPLTKCTNTAGGRTCGGCPTDYLGDGYLGCKDVNECATTECKFVDTKAPVIRVRTATSTPIKATSPDGAVVAYTATAVDNVDGPVAVSCDLASGTLFKIGTTAVTCTATDKRGNKRSTVTNITVNPAH